MGIKSIKVLYFFLIILSYHILLSQNKYNFDFETLDSTGTRPDGLSLIGSKDYIIKSDSVTKKDGKYSLFLAYPGRPLNIPITSYGFWLPAQYKGSQITLKGFIKSENNYSFGQAGLVIRLDEDTNKINLLKNMNTRGIRGTYDWYECSITLPLTDKIKNIYVGVFLSGKGKAWFDNLKVFINDIELSSVSGVSVKIYKAEKDKALYGGSGIVIENLDAKKIEDLTILGKIWGFLKYYHPEIAKGSYNWDFELFGFIPKLINCKNKNERSKTFINWINSLGKIEKCKTCDNVNLKNAKMLPDLNWLQDKSMLSNELIERLKFIKENRSQGEQYYISLYKDVRNPKFNYEDS